MFKMTRAIPLLVMSLFVLLFPITGSAQSSSAVTGVVTDTTGAIVAGATVTLTDTKTSKELTTTTDDQGVYRFTQVAPGQGYKLTFTSPGFQTLVINEVALGVGTTETHNAQLPVGSVSGQVEVTASNEATLNTTDASIGNVIETRRLTELPVQIRNSPAALIGLQPGVVGNNVGTATTNRVGSVTGSRADQGNITVDGIDANDQATGQFAATVGNAPIDAIQEFRAVTTNPNAAEGRSSGGQVELVTKSGTNDFHGNVREYNRTAKTAANAFFNNKSGIKRPQLTRNQFGGSLGGPIMKDKLFFFFDYEGRRDAQGVSYLRIVPLQSFRNGNIGYINNTAGCATNSRQNTTPNCISFLTPAQIQALDPQHVGVDQALLSFINSRYPLPNDLTAGDGINTGGFRFNAPSHRTDNTYTNRIDWNATSKQKIFGRWNIARRIQTDTVNSVAAQFPEDPETAQIQVKDYAWVVGHTWVASSNIVNQATVGASRSGLIFPTLFRPSFPNAFTFGAGLTAPYAGFSDQNRFVLVPTIRDDLTWVKGSHNFAFGAVIKPIDSKSGLTNDFNFVTIGLGGTTTALNASLRPANLRTGTTASGNYDSAFAFILGRVANVGTNYNYDVNGTAFAPGTGKQRDFKYNESEVYMQDNWKIRPNLTLTYGLRYQYYSPPYEKNGFQACQDVDFRQLFNLRQQNAINGVVGQTAEPLLRYDLCGKANNASGFYEPDLNNLAPRLSFAYNPSFKNGFMGKIFGDRKTVIRGGGSVVYDRVGGGITFIQDQVSYLFDNSATTAFGGQTANAALLNNPRFTGISNPGTTNVAPTISHPFTPFVDNTGLPTGNMSGEFNYAIDKQFKTPYAIQYSFGFQREMPGNFILEASYVGRQARKLFTEADAAQTLNYKDTASGQFLFGAASALQAGATTSTFFENQVNRAVQFFYGAPNCQALVGSTCTTFIRNNFGTLITNGDISDLVQALYANGLLMPNAGISGQFSTNIYISNQGASSYNGLLVSLRKRFSKGLQFDLNYTLSNSIDNQSSVVNTVSGGLVCDLTNLRACRGPSDFDIRHLFNANFIYELPFGKGHWLGGNAPGWVNQIIGGWEVTGIVTARSGLPFSTTTGSFPVGFNFNSPAVGIGPNSTMQGSIHDATGGQIQFFSDPAATLAALRQPHPGEIGNRNTFRGPGFWNVDTAVLKKFKMPWSETQQLVFRWESYNAFNHNSFGLPNALITSGSFGAITTSSSTPREMQFALRYEF